MVFKNFSNFSEYLNQKNFILLDGATGTLIQKSGVKYDHVPEVLNITHPELIESFHRRYIDADLTLCTQTPSVQMPTSFRTAVTALKKSSVPVLRLQEKPLRVQTPSLPLISVR